MIHQCTLFHMVCVNTYLSEWIKLKLLKLFYILANVALKISHLSLICHLEILRLDFLADDFNPKHLTMHSNAFLYYY